MANIGPITSMFESAAQREREKKLGVGAGIRGIGAALERARDRETQEEQFQEQLGFQKDKLSQELASQAEDRLSREKLAGMEIESRETMQEAEGELQKEMQSAGLDAEAAALAAQFAHDLQMAGKDLEKEEFISGLQQELLKLEYSLEEAADVAARAWQGAENALDRDLQRELQKMRGDTSLAVARLNALNVADEKQDELMRDFREIMGLFEGGKGEWYANMDNVNTYANYWRDPAVRDDALAFFQKHSKTKENAALLDDLFMAYLVEGKPETMGVGGADEATGRGFSFTQSPQEITDPSDVSQILGAQMGAQFRGAQAPGQEAEIAADWSEIQSVLQGLSSQDRAQVTRGMTEDRNITSNEIAEMRRRIDDLLSAAGSPYPMTWRQ